MSVLPVVFCVYFLYKLSLYIFVLCFSLSLTSTCQVLCRSRVDFESLLSTLKHKCYWTNGTMAEHKNTTLLQKADAFHQKHWINWPSVCCITVLVGKRHECAVYIVFNQRPSPWKRRSVEISWSRWTICPLSWWRYSAAHDCNICDNRVRSQGAWAELNKAMCSV